MHSLGDEYRNNLEKVTDECILKDIFLNDSNITVKIKAQELIKDTDFIYGECLNNPSAHLRIACLNHILDDNLGGEDEKNSLLCRLTLNDPDSNVCLKACENLDGAFQEVFTQIAKSQCDTSLRRLAISKIDDEEILKELAINDEDRFIRLEAIQNPNLTDLNTLSRIIADDEDEFNRYCACARIPDEDSLLQLIFTPSMYPRLEEIAKNTYFSMNDCFLDIFDDLDEFKKIVGLNFISDESFLNGIVLNEINPKLKAEAIKNPNFKNMKIINDLICESTDFEILFEVVKKTDDEKILMEYVKDNPDVNEISLNAVSKITDPDFLRGLLLNFDSRVRLQAVRRMAELGNFTSALHDFALTEPDRNICFEAIAAISKTSHLVDIADRLSDRDLRLLALERISEEKLIRNYITRYRSTVWGSLEDVTSRRVLGRIALADSDADIRRMATSKLSDKEVLDQIAYGDADRSVSKVALQRLESLWSDIKLVSDENILKEIYSNGDEDIRNAVQNQIDDLRTWRQRIREVSATDDVDRLKDIAANDYNYYVRCEAEGKLESILFDIRLDELERPENQKRLSKIALDDGFSLDIRNKAFSLLR